MRYLTPQLIVVVAFVQITTLVNADLGDQTYKLLPSDGTALDLFGCAVAVSGTTAIVGANQDDENGQYSGSAYLFGTSTGTQLFKLTPNDGAYRDSFGFAVAISGTTALVSGHLNNDAGPDSGSAYLFDTTTGQQLFKLLPNDGAAEDQFGFSVAINGTLAIVGSPYDDDNGGNSGSAYIFDTTTGQQLLKLLASDGEHDDNFGMSVALHGATAVIGAVGDDDLGYAAGAAYLFDVTTGQQLYKLLPNEGEAGDWIGRGVGIRNNTAIVGAPYHNTNSGSAYVFDVSTGQQIFELLPSGAGGAENFGWSVAVTGSLGEEVAILGATGDDDNGGESGSAFLFDIATGQELIKLLPDDGAANDSFGNAVGIDGTTAICGAYLDDDNGNNSGSAYLFNVGMSECPADLTGDQQVNIDDIFAVLGLWGTCADPCPPYCTGDLTDDCQVNIDDIFAILGQWGPC